MTKLRIGIISTARIGERRVIPAMQQSSNVEVTAVASRDLPRAQAFAAQLGIPKAYGAYEALFADPDVDAVYNPLPNSMHAEWTIKAAQAGKHVLCEKPFASNTAETDTMIAACASHKVVLMEAFMYRFHPQNEKAMALIRSGAIGKVQMVRAVFNFQIASETNIRLNAGLAGGALMDVGCYCVNAARTLAGAEPVRVSALAQFGAASRVDETLIGALQFPSGAYASIACSFRTPYRTHYEVIGERGRIELPQPFTTNNLPTRVLLHDRDDHTQAFEFPALDQYTRMSEHFARVVLDGEPLRYPPSEGRAQMRVLDALYESARTGRAVDLS
ncbi:MAG: Gfo/Idh/MocA family oxidoreductase [Chloroflexi bacterium]|nr:Gfo/Idh/MocA family oxidoreductase [Chloroflexota bacterium]